MGPNGNCNIKKTKKITPKKLNILEINVNSINLQFKKTASLTELLEHLNFLNSTLQTENHIISDLIRHINNFKNQIRLFIYEIESYRHFPSCQIIADEFLDTIYQKFIALLIEIQEQFDTRFQDIEILKNKNHF